MIKLISLDKRVNIKKKYFKSYVELANWAEKGNIPYGVYYAWAVNAKSLALIRKIIFEKGNFWVEGRGNI